MASDKKLQTLLSSREINLFDLVNQSVKRHLMSLEKPNTIFAAQSLSAVLTAKVFDKMNGNLLFNDICFITCRHMNFICCFCSQLIQILTADKFLL